MAGSTIRRQRGAGIIGLSIVLFLILMLAGLFSFDASRVQMAQRQLYSLAESSALAGTSMIASYDLSDDSSPDYPKLTNAQNNGIGYARNMAQAGTVLGNQLNSTIAPLAADYSSFLAPALGNCNIFIQMVDIAGTPLAVPNPQAKQMKVSLCYGYRPVFWPIFNTGGILPLVVAAIGGLPQVDAVLVFDLSGSMDDLTVVTIVDRVWDNNATGPQGSGATQTTSPVGAMNYIILPPSSPPVLAGQSPACLANYVGWNYTATPEGSEANVLPPQNLDTLGVPGPNGAASSSKLNYTPAAATPAGSGPLAFDCYTRVWPYWHVNSPNKCGFNQFGTPPGNCQDWCNSINGTPTQITYPNCTCFTDIVVNIGNPGAGPFAQPLTGSYPFAPVSVNLSTWGTYTINDPSGGAPLTLNYSTDLGWNYTYNFQNLGVLVEAARGNMEAAANLNAAYDGQTTYPNDQNYTFPACGGGYCAVYTKCAMLYSQPYGTAIDGAYTGFFQKLYSLADCDFGFVGFADNGWGGNTNWNAHEGAAAYWYECSDGADDSGYAFPYAGTTATNDTGSYYIGQGMSSGYPMCKGGGYNFCNIYRIPLTAGQTMSDIFSCVFNPATVTWPLLYGAVQSTDVTPKGGTDCGEALQTAVANFNNAGAYTWNAVVTNGNGTFDRRAARRAIVFFTDGMPTDQADGQPPTGNALAAAQSAQQEGIAMYTIGLAINTSLQTEQLPYLQGLATTAGNNSACFQVQSTADVKAAFSAVVRRLTEGQRSN